MSQKQLVLIPTPAAGHIFCAVELAKQLVEADIATSVSILLIKPADELLAVVSAQLNHPHIQFIQLPQVAPPSPDLTDSIEKFASVYMESHKSHVKDAILEHFVSKSIPVSGIIVDLFCTSMIDVANEFGVRSYVFSPTNALFVSFLLYFPIHNSETGREFFVSSDPDSVIPTRYLPYFAFDKDGFSAFLSHAIKFKAANGVIINTFAELEADTIMSLESQLGKTKVYPIGPLINHGGESGKSDPKRDEIVSWLDEQPTSSVIFLCFGSKGGFELAQLAEIATALENSGHRFLWSIQKPPSPEDNKVIREYNDFSEVLPEGFVERTKNRGLVCGWAPQVEVLAHEAVGGFVSHCGWNSILESLWYGVPIAAWPLYAEQHLNGFHLVKKLGLAVEVKLDYRMKDVNLVVVPNNEIEKALNSLIDSENPVRKKVQEMSDLSRLPTLQGGSSFHSMHRFLADVSANSG